MTITFYSSWDEIKQFKSKKLFKILQTCFADLFAPWHVQIILHVKLFFFYFNARDRTNRSKCLIQLRSNNVYCHSCFLSDWLSSKLTWKLYWCAPDLRVFAAVGGKNPSSPESSDDSVLIDPPFWGHLNIDLYFPFYFKAHSSNLTLLRVKPRSWKILDLARLQMHHLRERTRRRPTSWCSR